MQYKVLINSVKGLRKLVPYNADFYTKAIEGLQGKKEAYESIYIYNQEHFEQFKKTNSLAGIKNVVTDKVVFDFDSKEDLNKAFQDTKTLVSRLKADNFTDQEISLYFSSNKGFHVEINLEATTLSRDEFESITQSYAGDLETFDTAVSDEQRVFRLPLSYNLKSGGYKIPLTVQDIMSDGVEVQSIVDYSKAPDFDEAKNILANMSAAQNKFVVKQQKKVEVKVEKSTDFINDSLDLSKRPQHLSPAKYILQEGFFEEGERNEACMILASTYKFLGYNKEITYNILKATLRLRSERLGLPEYDKAELWNTIIEIVYGIHWKGGTYDESEGLLKKVKERFQLDERYNQNTLINVNELLDVTESFLKNLKDNRIYTGITSLDKNLILTKGMLFGVLGCPGSGKTSFLNVFAENTSKNYGPVLYFSMDMSKDLLGIKILQRYTGYSIEKLEDMLLHGTSDKIYKEAKEKLKEDYKNIVFCFENGYDVAMISDEIKRTEDRVGKRMSMVAVDYLEKVQGPYSDETANSGFVASNLSNLAKRHDTCIGLLLQPSKATGAPSDPIKSYRSIKGASKIEQDCRAVIGIWRPGYSPDDFANDKYMSIAILKQNMGKLGKYDFNWDGSRGHVSEMSKDERTRFTSFMEELENRKAEEDEGTGFKRFGNKSNGDTY